MFITLTNATPAHKGKSITVNSDHIVSLSRADAVRAVDDDGNPKETEEVTFVFIPPHGTWEVEELPEDIAKLLN
jgi:hypothetical protein